MRQEVALTLADLLESERFKGREGTERLSQGEGEERRWGVDGVLCEAAIEAEIIGAPVWDPVTCSWQYEGHLFDLPLAVQAWAQYDPPRELYVVSRLCEQPRGLVTLNDLGATFPELAGALRSVHASA